MSKPGWTDVEHWWYEQPPPDSTRLGISLSGGGIRSATFSLGVYQRLAEAGVFQRARYLSAVSGGSYLAAGLAISNARCPSELADARPGPWGRGSPEEDRLRRNLSYIAPGGKGRLWLFANILYGLILNLAPLVLSAFLGGRIVGVLLGELYPGLGDPDRLELDALRWVVGAIVVLVALSVVVVGVRRFRDKRRSLVRRGMSRSERNVVAVLCTAAVLTVFVVALPAVVHLLASFPAKSLTSNLGSSETAWRIQRLLVGLAAVAIAAVLGAGAVWLLRRRRLRTARGVMAGVAGGAVIVVPFVLAAEASVTRGFSLPRDGLVWLGECAVLGLFAVFAHNRRYSMHLFYRERLHEAFASERKLTLDPEHGARIEADSVPYETSIWLSDVAARNADASTPRFPELIMCAAVAAREEVPSKARAASFTFEGTRSGNGRLGLRTETETFEEGRWIGGGGLTLPSIMAISGAAISPLMGRFTLPAFRFLMAILNIRLGVWIRHPRHPAKSEIAPGNPLRRMWDYLVRGWYEPGALYVLKEGLGRADIKKKYIYVSDGGHWENLGLTELLRRRCTHVVVVDASGDPGLGDIGRALAVARAELGVEFAFDPRPTCAGESGLAATPVQIGTFRYPSGQVGDIYYCRCVMWEGAPADLHLFRSREQKFPNHPTSNQFLSGELFDAYRALGWAAGEQLVESIRLPQERLEELVAAPAGNGLPPEP